MAMLGTMDWTSIPKPKAPPRDLDRGAKVKLKSSLLNSYSTRQTKVISQECLGAFQSNS